MGLRGEPGDDPALQALAAMANGAQSGIHLIERLVRYLRYRGIERFPVSTLASTGLLVTETPDELRAACEWLVAQRQAEWLNVERNAVRLLHGNTRPRNRGRRSRRSPVA